jgi:hypothetical protein
MYDLDPKYVESHLDEMNRLSKQARLLHQSLRTKAGTWERMMVRLGSALIYQGNRLLEGHLYSGLSNHRA